MMKLNVSLLAFIVAAVAAKKSEKHPIREEIVEEIKLKTTSWTPKAVEDNHMRHQSVESLKYSMGNMGSSPTSLGAEVLKKVAHGAFDVFHQISSLAGLSKKEEVHRLKQFSDANLPTEFSWRKQMPECLGMIENQGDCGSCWAFTSAGLLSDRYCIHSQGAINVRLSPQEMVNCNYENYGCSGGYLLTSIDYLMVEGAVPNTCVSYIENQALCSFECDGGNMTNYEKYYCSPGSLELAVNADEIKYELFHNGPMLMGLTIMEDFLSYESGVYKYITGGYVGGHAMKLVGYGEDPVEGLYWELQNQWSEDFGEEGFIKIKHGEIGIDAVALSCMPSLH